LFRNILIQYMLLQLKGLGAWGYGGMGGGHLPQLPHGGSACGSTFMECRTRGTMGGRTPIYPVL